MSRQKCDFSDLKGKTLVDAFQIGSSEIIFVCSTGERYRSYHSQD